ncbi:MAG: hypothetical protein AAGF12_35740 [Myxococcota bacterium]
MHQPRTRTGRSPLSASHLWLAITLPSSGCAHQAQLADPSETVCHSGDVSTNHLPLAQPNPSNRDKDTAFHHRPAPAARWWEQPATPPGGYRPLPSNRDPRYGHGSDDQRSGEWNAPEIDPYLMSDI